jgi:hypothetical protein
MADRWQYGAGTQHVISFRRGDFIIIIIIILIVDTRFIPVCTQSVILDTF